MSQIITVTFAQGQYEAVADQPLAQWAYGQKLKFVGLELPAAYAVDFSNWEFQGDSIQRIGNADGVAVPTEILTSGRNVYAFIWITDANSGRRRYMAMARVIPGPGPDPEEPNPQESSEISEVLAELNAAVETAEDAASRGPQIRNGYWYTWSAESQEYENTEVPSTGNKIWWTTAVISTIPGSRYVVLLPNLNGPAGTSPAVSDLVVGPAPNTSGSATYLYYIFSIDTALQQVILKSIGSIKGAKGDPGNDGVSPRISVSEITGGHRVSTTDAQGTETFDVMNGEQGPAGPSGGQFWSTNSAYTSPSYTWAISSLTGPENGTPAIGDLVYYSTYRYTITSIDAENQTVTCTIRASIRGQQGPAGQGVPVGGDQAQILSKKSATDYDTQWSDLIDLLPSELKSALLQLAQKVAYIDDDGADYYQDLYDALYPPKELLYITAVYTQSGTVYDDASLDSLRSDLVVTAKWEDNTETYVTTYTLSGTLAAGTSAVTVSYNGKTTTFNVTVTARPTLSSITAVYTQSGYVFTTDSLDSLKSGLVVTAHYSDSSSETVSSDEYTLAGTLTAGTSTVTVSCGGKTTTFTVSVSEVPSGYNTNGLIFFLDGKTATASSWTDRVGGREFTLTNCSLVTNGVQFDGSSSYGEYQGSISGDWQNETIEIVFDGRESITSSTILSQPWDDNTMGHCGICMRFGYNNANQPRFAIVYDTDNHPFYYATLNQDTNRVGVNVDRAIYNETAATGSYSTYYGRNRSGNSYVGATYGSNGIASFYKGKILAVRIYNRKLSQAEIVANQQVDATYYSL